MLFEGYLRRRRENLDGLYVGLKDLEIEEDEDHHDDDSDYDSDASAMVAANSSPRSTKSSSGGCTDPECGDPDTSTLGKK